VKQSRRNLMESEELEWRQLEDFKNSKPARGLRRPRNKRRPSQTDSQSRKMNIVNLRKRLIRCVGVMNTAIHGVVLVAARLAC
jgi:hypothetical protein